MVILALSSVAILLPVTVAAQDATLTLQSSSASVMVGEGLTLSGTLSAPENGTVYLFWSINCTCFNHQDDLIMLNGQFSKVFSAPSPGSYYFKVMWMGDDEYNSAQSNIVIVSVSQGETADIAFSANGIAEDVGTLLSVDGLNYTVAQLPKVFAWVVGSSHSYAWHSPVNSSTAVFTWTSTAGLSTLQYGNLTAGSEGGSVVATYQSSVPMADVTFSVQGLAGYTGAVLGVDGTNYTAAQLPKTFAWQENSTHPFSWYSPLSSPTAVYIWSSTNGMASTQSGSVEVGSAGGSLTATYQLSSPNRSPIPVISFSPTIVWTGLGIAFDASASYDPDGTITTYVWDFGDFTSSNSAVATHAYGVPGYYIVALAVVDDEGAEGRTSITIEVTGVFPLNVTSNIGSPMQGSGLYPAGSVIQISAPAEEPVPGIMGTLGSKYAFQQWTGAVNSAQRTVSVTVDYQASQLGLVAVYAEQNTAAMMAIAAIAAVAMVAASLFALFIVWKMKSSLYYALAMILVIVGITGTVMGYYFAQEYWFDTGHPVVVSLGQLALIIGPIVAAIGAVLFIVFHKALKK